MVVGARVPCVAAGTYLLAALHTGFLTYFSAGEGSAGTYPYYLAYKQSARQWPGWNVLPAGSTGKGLRIYDRMIDSTTAQRYFGLLFAIHALTYVVDWVSIAFAGVTDVATLLVIYAVTTFVWLVLLAILGFFDVWGNSYAWTNYNYQDPGTPTMPPPSATGNVLTALRVRPSLPLPPRV